jgi:hypothetical protein
MLGATHQTVTCSNDLIALYFQCLQQRMTYATGVHDASSRSHLVCSIWLPGGGALTMVDLAGGEWSHDQAQHTAERIEEAKLIRERLFEEK